MEHELRLGQASVTFETSSEQISSEMKVKFASVLRSFYIIVNKLYSGTPHITFVKTLVCFIIFKWFQPGS